MRGIDSETIDLIYLDPPFNKKKKFKSPLGRPAKGAEFKDIWTDEDVRYGQYSQIAADYPQIHQIILAAEHTYDRSMMIYLMAMSIRLVEMHRILKPDGSIYLHCDPTASHYLKLVMDAIFDKEAFRNEIAWCFRGGGVPKNAFARKHHILLFYAKSRNNYFDKQYVPYSEASQNLVENRGGVSIDGIERDLDRGASMPDWWTDINSLQTWSPERTGWPTQKPLALLKRIIKTSSHKNDIVLDPFCGCATACIAAEQLGRQWIGIDIAAKAETITKNRLLEEVQPLQTEFWHDIEARVTVTSEVPIRTDIHAYQEELRQLRLPHYRVHKNTLYGQQEGYCNGCHRHYEIKDFTVDHKTPHSQGGTDHVENLQLLCQNCNAIKGDRSQEYLDERLRERGIL